MNFLQQKRVLIGIVIVLLIFNMTMGITILIHVNDEKSNQEQSQDTDFLKSELSLNNEQVQGLGRIRSQFRATSEPVALRIREIRQQLVDEMSKNQPDTLRIKMLSEEMGKIQGDLTYKIATQYLDIRQLCSPDQALKLNASYHYLFGLDDQSHQSGKGYRYRWGQRKKSE